MKLSGIETDSIVDGLGIRMTLFFQGCPHNCLGCHNPSTWDYDKECLDISVEEVLEKFDNNTLLAGITLSGGEPLSLRNESEIIKLCTEIKKRGKNIWAYTGYVIEELEEKVPSIYTNVLPLIDILVDGPFIQDKKNLMLDFRGSENQRVISVKEYLNN